MQFLTFKSSKECAKSQQSEQSTSCVTIVDEPALALGTFYPTVYTFLTPIWINIIHLPLIAAIK
jgi:hypothetical protein